MIRSGRIISSLFLALLVLTLLLTVAGLGWYGVNPAGRVIGSVDSVAGTDLRLINDQQQVLAVQLVPNGRIASYLNQAGLPREPVTLAYRGETAVSLYLPEQNIYELPPAWMLWLISSAIVLILLLLLFPTKLEKLLLHK